MYYLHSRYYDPAIGRFINADKFAATGQGIVGCNMFAYCGDNPVNVKDSNGAVPTCCIMLQDGGTGIGDAIPDITEQFMALMKAHAFELRAYFFRCYEEELFSLPYLYGESVDESQESILENCASIALLKTMLFFRAKEIDNGEWDIKQDEKYNYTKDFIFFGKIYSGEQLGNIHYGYVGSAVFPPLILYLGAGYNQSTKGFHIEYWPYLFDKPDDFLMVSFGIRLYSGGET